MRKEESDIYREKVRKKERESWKTKKSEANLFVLINQEHQLLETKKKLRPFFWRQKNSDKVRIDFLLLVGVGCQVFLLGTTGYEFRLRQRQLW